MNQNTILHHAMTQSAIDLNCNMSDFQKNENVITKSVISPKVKSYLEQPTDCTLVSYGTNIVASVKEEYIEIADTYINQFKVKHCFEPPNMYVLNDALQKYGKKVCFLSEYFLPELKKLKKIDCEYEIRVLEQDAFTKLYTEEWANALCEERKELDVLGVGAYHDGKLVGLAACSADCEMMWQIGVDVLPDYRRQGIASSLTSRLALAILERGKIPFYCCAWSNLQSVRNALKSGFVPAWIELSVKDNAFINEVNLNFK